MIYNTNLDFRMMHILDAFDTSSMHSTTDCMNIANFLQVALYLKCCSKMVKDIEPTGFISKSKVRNKIGFYLYRQNRWDVFASRNGNDKGRKCPNPNVLLAVKNIFVSIKS